MNFQDVLDSVSSFHDDRLFTNGNLIVKRLSNGEISIKDKNGCEIVIPEFSYWSRIDKSK